MVDLLTLEGLSGVFNIFTAGNLLETKVASVAVFILDDGDDS
jgi:hypothetical protein